MYLWILCDCEVYHASDHQATIFITGLVVIVHALKFQTIDFILVFILLIGSIIGLHIGLRISQKLNASEYKTLLAILLLAVGLIMGIESFILEDSLFFKENVGEINNRLSEIVLNLSNNYPFVYGFISIIIVILIGISFSYARELIHYMRYDVKKYNIFK